MQLPIASTGVEESLCVAKASTCNDCNKGYVSMPKSSYLVWKGFVPIKCSHGGEIRNLIVDPDMQPEVIEQVQIPQTVEPTTSQDGSVSRHGETTTGRLKDYLERVRVRSGEALQHLLAWAHVAEYSPAPAYFPELDIEHVRTRATLVEERTEKLNEALKVQIKARRALQEVLPESDQPEQLVELEQTVDRAPKRNRTPPVLPRHPQRNRTPPVPPPHPPSRQETSTKGQTAQQVLGNPAQLAVGVIDQSTPLQPRDTRQQGAQVGYNEPGGPSATGDGTVANPTSTDQSVIVRRSSLTASQSQVGGCGPPEVARNTTGGTPLHVGTYLFNWLRPALPAPTDTVPERPDVKESQKFSIAESRRQLLEAKITAWEKQSDTLEVSVSKVRDNPSVLGVKVLRTRKDELEKKALAAHSVFEDVLSFSYNDTRLALSRELGVRQIEVVNKRLESIEEAISQCEEEVLDIDLGGNRSGGQCWRNSPCPSSQGSPLTTWSSRPSSMSWWPVRGVRRESCSTTVKVP